jgi:16S rRNA (guanine527-N7)-methyltransferase
VGMTPAAGTTHAVRLTPCRQRAGQGGAIHVPRGTRRKGEPPTLSDKVDVPRGTDDQIDTKLQAFAELLRACPHNLMSQGDLALVEERHIPECLQVAHQLPACEVMADVGSGGGFPGLVIAIARPDLEVHLIESVRKKAEFLFDTAEELELNVKVHHARAEDLARGDLAEHFPIVTARAVARLDRLIAWTMPLVASGGELWAIKGDQWPSEVREARKELRRLRASVVQIPTEHPDAANQLARVVRITTK